jgi:MFS family permease
VTTLGQLRLLRREPHFGRLYATRLVSQAADGALQLALASAVFFSPTESTDARGAATGITVLLLPYSMVGPFAGVLLDRWRRRRVLMVANLIRAAVVCVVAGLLASGPADPALYLAALAAISVNRFSMSGLAAALPHVVRSDLLVMANSVCTTSGYVATMLGGLVGLLVRALIGSALGGGAAAGNAGAALLAALAYLAAARIVAGYQDLDLLGPDQSVDLGQLRHALAGVFTEMAEGARYVWARRPAAYAMAAMGAHRFCYGLSTIATLLLYRNYFTDSGVFRAGLVGLGQVVCAGAIGAVAAAAATPAATARLGKPAWIVRLFAGGCAVELALGLPYTLPAWLAAALLLGFAAQAAKITVDTIVQQTIADGARGRVFALYDMAFNVSFIASAVLGAFLLPANGKSYVVLVGIAAGYGGIALSYRWASGRLPLIPPTRPSVPLSRSPAHAPRPSGAALPQPPHAAAGRAPSGPRAGAGTPDRPADRGGHPGPP